MEEGFRIGSKFSNPNNSFELVEPPSMIIWLFFNFSCCVVNFNFITVLQGLLSMRQCNCSTSAAKQMHKGVKIVSKLMRINSATQHWQGASVEKTRQVNEGTRRGPKISQFLRVWILGRALIFIKVFNCAFRTNKTKLQRGGTNARSRRGGCRARRDLWNGRHLYKFARMVLSPQN